LIGGLLFCDCGRKWVSRTTSKRHNRKGELVERKTPIGVYYCGQRHKELRSPECPRTINSKKADEIVWGKVCAAIEKPEYLLGQAKVYVAELRKNANNLQNDKARLENELEALIIERQTIITLARKRAITATDLEYQLGALTMQEISLKHELSSLGQAISINALNNWEASVSEYLADLQAGSEELNNAAPQKEEERQEIFRLKKRVVDTLVKRITIDRDRELSVEIRLNLLDIIEEEPQSSAVHLGKDGIYTRKFDFYRTLMVVVTI